MNKVTVVGSVISGNGILLFFADGKSQVLSQENWRTQDIMAAVMPKLSSQENAEIDLDDFSIAAKIAEVVGPGVEVKDSNSGDGFSLKAGKTVIAKGEALIQHIERAKLDGVKGFRKFLKKFEEIKRKHSADELLEFMEGADLPIADNGDLIGFKILCQTDDEGVMVDPHTHKVRQKLGSLVYMPDSKVDDNRHVLCSTGLHIAARNYLGGFWSKGRRLCLVKIKPKDVISVPLYEKSKMRVSAYHIVGVFSEADGQNIVFGKEIDALPDAYKLLCDVVAGSHTPILEKVIVGAQGEHKIEPVAKVRERAPKKKTAKVSKVSITKPVSKPAVKIDPRDVNILKKLKRNNPALKERDQAYLNKLVKAQRMLDSGKSIRQISAALGMDRESLGKNLIRKAS